MTRGRPSNLPKDTSKIIMRPCMKEKNSKILIILNFKKKKKGSGQRIAILTVFWSNKLLESWNGILIYLG